MESYASHPVVIIIEDHNPNFRNFTKCRRINLGKNKSRLVSKKHLEEIITNAA